jgi:hypothetical protein
VLGLERNVDARVPEDANDAMPVHVCLDDRFDDGQLDMARWDRFPGPGITIRTEGKLIFRFTTGATPGAPAIVRSKATFDLQAGALEARIDLGPQLITETTLAITSAGDDPIYEMRITSDDQLHLRRGGAVLQTVPLAGNFLRMRFVGDQMYFGSGASAGTFVETMAAALEPVANAKVQLSAAVSGAVTAGVDVNWANIVVHCQ